MDKHVYSPFIQCFPVDLVITRYPEKLVVVSIILWAYCLAVLCHLNTPTGNSRTYRVSAPSQLFRCFTKIFEILFDPSKILSSFIALQILVYFHYGCFPYIWQYSLVSFDTIILILLIQHVCECTQSSINPSKLSFRLRHHFEHELVLDQTICRQLCLWSIQLIHPWSERLLLILCFGNHNSIAFKLWIIQMIP